MGGIAARSTILLVLAALAVAMTASTGGAAGSKRTPLLLGIVPHSIQTAAVPFALSRALRPASPTTLTFDANYETLINQYFTDVAAGSGSANNVYSVGTQYNDNTGHVQYQSTFGGSYVSHAPLPANGCDDGVDTYCLTDEQLQDEIQTVLDAKGWTGGLGHMFFLMTPNGVGSCGDSTGFQCTTNAFCAYHSAFVDSNLDYLIYANEPYLGPSGGCTEPSEQGFPNGDVDSDTTINTISHEHNEAITDPLGNAWVNPTDDSEDGDLCAYGFGTQLGGTAGVDAYNQVINTHHYELQQEWSNQTPQGCAQFLGGPATPNTLGTPPLDYQGGPVMHTNTTYAIYWLPTPGNTSLPVVTGTAAPTKTLTSTPGSWNGAPTTFSYQWQRCSSAGTGCVDISGATAATYKLTDADGGHTVRSTVRATNVNGKSPAAASATTAVVAQLPASTGLPVVSGVAAVGKQLSTTNGTWNTLVSYAYQWLRCAASGSGCAAITGATTAQYVLRHADAGHTLEVRVSGTNVLGSASAVSTHTGVVIDVPSATKAPHISGRARVGKKLSGSHGSWTYFPTGYRFQWLRCNAQGGSCAAIRHATHPTYKLTRHDSQHRLRLRITATNTAGSKVATSTPSARVH